MVQVQIPFAYTITGKARGKRKESEVRVAVTESFFVQEMDADAEVVAILPFDRNSYSATEQASLPRSELVWWDGAFWTQFSLSDNGYQSEIVVVEPSDMDGERFHNAARVGGTPPSSTYKIEFVQREADAGLVRDVVSTLGRDRQNVQSNLSEYALRNGKLLRKTMEPVLVLEMDDPQRYGERRQRNTEEERITPWAKVVYRSWAKRDPGITDLSFSDASMQTELRGSRKLAHADVYRLDEADRMATMLESVTLKYFHDFRSDGIEILRPDRINFDRDVYVLSRALRHVVEALRRGTPDLVAVRARTRLDAIIEDVGQDPRRIYPHASEIRDAIESVRGQLQSHSSSLGQIDSAFGSAAFEQRLAEHYDMDALSGRVSYRHSQAETVFVVTPVSGGSDLTDLHDEIERRLGDVDGFNGLLPSVRGEELLVRVSALADEEEVMAQVRETVQAVVAEGPKPMFGFQP